jgi:hypothetical protein
VKVVPTSADARKSVYLDRVRIFLAATVRWEGILSDPLVKNEPGHKLLEIARLVRIDTVLKNR